MATITVRNLEDEVQRRLKRRAAKNGRSMEAEARAILTEAVGSDGFGDDWIALLAPFRGDFELPDRSEPRTVELA
jgi:plasmid stability protein